MNLKHLIAKNKAKVAKEMSNFSVGDTVFITDTSNMENNGLAKKGRTGTIKRIADGQYLVQLHCTNDKAGNVGKSTFIEKLGRFVKVTNEMEWFHDFQISKK